MALVGLAASSILIIAVADRAAAEVHALVVGINDYTGGPPKLKGAVNDANDVASVLRANGVGDVTLLIDADATREKAFAAWEAMVKNSAEGDLLVFTFAGHGINVEDANKDEEDGKDESYLFVGFDEEQHPDQQLIDDELDAWLKQAGDAGRKVLFIADACHSGSPTRSVFGETLPTRFYRPRTEPERPRPLVSLDDAPASAGRDYVYSVGATLDSRTVPEIMIGDAPRGALSYAVARAFEGSADLDHDGHVLAKEFTAFVRQNVRSLAASKQTPQFDIPDEGLRIIEVVGDGTAPAATADSSIRIHIRQGADQTLIDSVAGISGVSLVDDEAAAHLIFDPASGSLVNNMRDVVAENLDAGGLKTAIEADRALTALQQLSLSGTLPIAFSPDDGVQPEGTEIEFTVAGVQGRYPDGLRPDGYRLGALPLADRPGRQRPNRRQRVLASGRRHAAVRSRQSGRPLDRRSADGIAGRSQTARRRPRSGGAADEHSVHARRATLRDRHPGVFHEAEMTSMTRLHKRRDPAECSGFCSSRP